MHNQTDEKKTVTGAMNASARATTYEHFSSRWSDMQPRDVEEAYRRGFSQGAAQAAYAVKAGATAAELEAWRKAIWPWRHGANKGVRPNIRMTEPPLPKIGGAKR